MAKNWDLWKLLGVRVLSQGMYFDMYCLYVHARTWNTFSGVLICLVNYLIWKVIQILAWNCLAMVSCYNLVASKVCSVAHRIPDLWLQFKLGSEKSTPLPGFEPTTSVSPVYHTTNWAVLTGFLTWCIFCFKVFRSMVLQSTFQPNAKRTQLGVLLLPCLRKQIC